MTTHAAVAATSRAQAEHRTALRPGAVVTPEGVLLEYSTVGIGTRLVSRLVDIGLQFSALFAALVVIGLLGSVLSRGMVFALIALAGFATIFVYPITLELTGRRQTFGQRTANVRIVSLDGGPIRFRQAAIRAMLLPVDLFVTSGFAGAVAILSSQRGQRLGDMAAGTMAVRLPSRSLRDLASESPAVAKRLPAEVDLRRLTDDEIDVALELLSRGGELNAGAQVFLASSLSDRFAERLGMPRPVGWSHADHVRAVVDARARAGSHRIATR